MDAVPHFDDAAPRPNVPTIGSILVEAGRLREEDRQAVLREQREQGGPFGLTAMRLGLLDKADIDFALARQFGYPCVSASSGLVAGEMVAAYQPFSPIAEHLRALRSQLTLRWLKANRMRNSLAVLGIARRDGRSFVAANLAVSFAQSGARTLLIDADLRHPSLHELLHLSSRIGLSTLLAGRAGNEAIVRIAALRNLYVLPAGPPPPNPQELLGSARFTVQLRALEGLFDVVICDTTASAIGADSQFVAAASGASLLVVRKNATALAPLRSLGAALGAAGSRVVGAVVNRG